MKQRAMGVAAACLFVLASAGAGIAEAQLVKSDFLVPGDGLLVTDTATGLVWLSPLYTRGQSYNDVIAGFGDLLTTHGFQFATPAQVRALIQNNFDNPPLDPGTTAGYTSALEFFDVFGIAENVFCLGTTPPGPCPRTQGWTVEAGILTQLGMITIGNTYGFMLDNTYPEESWVYDLRDGQRGSWLYRLAPPSNTQPGTDVIVSPPVVLPNGTPSSVFLQFDAVTNAGDTTVTATSQGAPPPSGFKLTNPPIYYDIVTTASFRGSVRVCLGWTEGQISNEKKVSIFHYENGAWVDITDATSRDTVNNKVCGTASSLSPFTLLEVKYPFTGFFQPVDGGGTFNSAKAGSAIPVKFSLGANEGLDIFAAGFPQVVQVQCDSRAPLDAIEETVNASSNSLTYDSASGRYNFVWKTSAAWARTCRQLQVKLNDGETYTALFSFK